MVGQARRQTQRAHLIVPEGESDGGGVGEDVGYEINCKCSKWHDAAHRIPCLLLEKWNKNMFTVKQKILKQVVDKLAELAQEKRSFGIFDLGKDIITACPSADDINDYIEPIDFDRFDQMGFTYISSNGANRDELRFVDGVFHTYPDAYDFLSKTAKSMEGEYKKLPDAVAFKNYIDNLIKESVGKMHLSDYNRQSAKDSLTNHLRYIIQKAVVDYKNSGYDVNRIEKSLHLYATGIHPFG